MLTHHSGLKRRSYPVSPTLKHGVTKFSAEMLSLFAVRNNAVQREGASTVSINHPLAAYFGRTE